MTDFLKIDSSDWCNKTVQHREISKFYFKIYNRGTVVQLKEKENVFI